ncbi:MAG: hypothetical protein BWY11_01752 [Firmicutes bacterium ADurb.Bin182]|nr:MAG: hypothetical protein BWY11_01752 [Firmicutes bacterium ADurb.Bin182]
MMQKLRIMRILFILLLLIAASAKLFLKKDLAVEADLNAVSLDAAYETGAKRDILALMIAYPEHITGLEKDDNEFLFVLMKSGDRIIYDDKKAKTFEQKLAGADIQDCMEQVYPLKEINNIPEKNFDPGRIRVYEFLHAVYGKTRSEIENNLANARAGSQGLSFNKRNGAAASYETAFSDVSKLIKNDPGVYGFVFPINGTYNYRTIKGTNRLSPHAFGIAVDLKSNPHDYWQWATKEQGQSRLESYPKSLVRVFENHNFIWGGKWNHFDFLHFEYRPELIIKSKYYIPPGEMKAYPWHYGFPGTDEVKVYIDMIDSVFE